MAKDKVSSETQTEASAIAKATQKPGQTKEQTKLIAKGIEKGIAEYKKRQKAKSREFNKKKKRLDQQLATDPMESQSSTQSDNIDKNSGGSTPLIIILIASILLNVAQALNFL